MKKILISLTFLLSLGVANSQTHNNSNTSNSIQELFKQESLSTELRVIREARQTREKRTISVMEVVQKLDQNSQRGLRQERQERLVIKKTREDRNIRYVTIKERNYIAKIK